MIPAKGVTTIRGFARSCSLGHGYLDERSDVLSEHNGDAPCGQCHSKKENVCSDDHRAALDKESSSNGPMPSARGLVSLPGLKPLHLFQWYCPLRASCRGVETALLTPIRTSLTRLFVCLLTGV